MKPIGLSAVATVVVLAAALACAGDGQGPTEPGNNNDDDPGNGISGPSFAGSVQPIFTQSCALSECHAGAAPVQDMSLEPGKAFNDIVNVKSNVATLTRIRPFLPDSSFLLHKIQGTQASVGDSSGARMPLRNCCLSQDQIAVVRAWILAGARNN